MFSTTPRSKAVLGIAYKASVVCLLITILIKANEAESTADEARREAIEAKDHASYAKESAEDMKNICQSIKLQ